jgi:hypothetical protein
VPVHDAVRARCEAHRRSLFVDAGVFGSNVVREVPCFVQAMAQEGLQGGKGDTHAVAQPQPIHDPGIHYEPRARGIPSVFTVDWRTSRIERCGYHVPLKPLPTVAT